MWFPVNGLDLPTEPSSDRANLAVSIKPKDAPRATELKDWIQTEKDLSVAETLSLGFAPFSMDESGSHRTIVLDAMRYCDKDRVRWGVGLRFILHAWSETTTVKGSVALVAAQASLNMVYTRATLQILGCDLPRLAKLLPSFEEMNVSSYADLLKALDQCRDAVLGASPDQLTPTAIAVSIQSPPPEHHAWLHIHHS